MKVKFISSILLTLVIMVQPVAAATYKSGDRIEILSASIPADGVTISFTMPQGTYPKNATVAVYAEANVICPMPGYTPEAKSPDKNPITLLSEYKLSEVDNKALESSDATFIATAKFDPQCGDMYAKVYAANEAVKPAETQATRPSGGGEGAVDNQGNPLTRITSGMKLDTEFSILSDLLIYMLPQGSYTLGDWLVVFNKDNVAIAKTIIDEELMDALAKDIYEIRSIVNPSIKTNELTLMVSDIEYELGVPVELPQMEQKPSTSKFNMNSIAIGIASFVIVMVLGLAINYLKERNKKK